jgi:putative transcriptional regulator
MVSSLLQSSNVNYKNIVRPRITNVNSQVSKNDNSVSGEHAMFFKITILGMDTKTLGNRILLARRDLGLKQEELASRAGVSRAYITNIEQGRAKNVGIDVIFAIARELGVTVPYLLGLSDEEVAQAAGAPAVGVGISEEAEEAARIIDNLASLAQRKYCLDMIRMFVGYGRDIEREWTGEIATLSEQVGPEAAHLVSEFVHSNQPIPTDARLAQALLERKHLKAPA